MYHTVYETEGYAVGSPVDGQAVREAEGDIVAFVAAQFLRLDDDRMTFRVEVRFHVRSEVTGVGQAADRDIVAAETVDVHTE